jgi:uncharacterized surface protein with fasciclin (FAS1) repeats
MKKVLIAVAVSSVLAAVSAFAGGYGGGMDTNHKQAAQQQAAATSMDIVDTAVAAGSFATLVQALQTADLVATLKGKGPFTVFAPTDAAFAKLPSGTVEALLKDKEKLTKVLTYHVVSGEMDATAVMQKQDLMTVEGSDLAVANIKISQTDIQTSNGIIHVIDEVLIPAT